MSDIDRRGVERVHARGARVPRRAPRSSTSSLDLDAVDPMFAPGVGTPVRGGLSYREAHLALELVAESGLLDSLELVEVNPILDRGERDGVSSRSSSPRARSARGSSSRARRRAAARLLADPDGS